MEQIIIVLILVAIGYFSGRNAEKIILNLLLTGKKDF